MRQDLLSPRRAHKAASESPASRGSTPQRQRPQISSPLTGGKVTFAEGTEYVDVKPRVKPVVPPKPPMDTYRYSMINLQESPDVDLDALLSELNFLESELSSNGPIFSNMSHVSKKPASSTSATARLLPSQSSSHQQQLRGSRQATPVSSGQASGYDVTSEDAMTPQSNAQTPVVNGLGFSAAPTHTVSPNHASGSHCQTHSQNQGSNNVMPYGMPIPPNPAPAPINSERRSQNKQHRTSQADSGISVVTSVSVTSVSSTQGNVRPHSPDNDSAFCDSASLLSAESVGGSQRSRDSNGSSAESSRASLTTPSPTQLQKAPENDGLTPKEREEQIKAEKIKLALEKMKEAAIKKLYVKFFTGTGSSKSLLVDERWNVANVLRQLAEKENVPLNEKFALVEHYPDLYMERIYEDHEYLIENILLWTRDSPNKLIFAERHDKYHFFHNPQDYLLSAGAADRESREPSPPESTRKQQIIQEFFAPTNIQPPEVEGTLWLKADGKKVWKKHYFVLRASGLYYVKGKSKASKDLEQFKDLEVTQTYVGFGWKKKYKAPSDHGFALKHPNIQVKASKYIKYLCCEDEETLNRWMAGFRILKTGRELHENYSTSREYHQSQMQSGDSSSLQRSVSSDSGDYSRENIVIRPKSGNFAQRSNSVSASVPSLDEVQQATDVNLRNSARSAEIRHSGAIGKRNSRGSLTAVDLPMVPENGCLETQGHYIQSPRLDQHRRESSNRLRDSRSSSASVESENGSAQVFDAEAFGTIKRRPAPSPLGLQMQGVPVLPVDCHGKVLLKPPNNLSIQTKIPLTDTTRSIHSHINRKSVDETMVYQNGHVNPVIASPDVSSESAFSMSSGNSSSTHGILTPGVSNNAEYDSDEEEFDLPPPPPELLIPATNAPPSYSFPAPPSPLPPPPDLGIGGGHINGVVVRPTHITMNQENVYANIEATYANVNGHTTNGYYQKASNITVKALPTPNHVNASIPISPQSPKTPTMNGGNVTPKFRPPPPKRAESTRLSTVAVPQLNGGQNPKSPIMHHQPLRTVTAPMIIPQQQNVAPVPVRTMSVPGPGPVVKAGPRPPPVAPKPKLSVPSPANTGADFMNDLQAAMQRRAQRQGVQQQ